MADPKGLLVVPVGFRSDGTIHALELDDSDQLKVAVALAAGSVVEVEQDTPADLQATVTPAAAAEFEVVQPVAADLLATVTPAAAVEFEVVQPVAADLLATVTPAAAVEFEVVQPVAADLLATVIPGASEKIIGFRAVVEESISNTNLAAGSNLLSGTAVPSGEIYVITNAGLRYDGTVPPEIFIRVNGLGSGVVVLDQFSPVSTRWYPGSFNLVLQVGDYVEGVVSGATAGDQMYLRYSGYRFDAP